MELHDLRANLSVTLMRLDGLRVACHGILQEVVDLTPAERTELAAKHKALSQAVETLKEVSK